MSLRHALFAALALASHPGSAAAQPVLVTVKSFPRAESHMYFEKKVREGAFGRLSHVRAIAPIDRQDVIRMNRDTLYSSGVFDLDAGPVTITLPDAGKRFVSLLVINEDHYTRPVVYAPGSYTLTREEVGTRYAYAIVRTLANAADGADVEAANEVQDRIGVRQAARGRFEIPEWDPASRDRIREALLLLSARSGATTEERFGSRAEVDPVQHLLSTASGWGGNPRAAAIYVSVAPLANDGATVQRLTVRDVPVDGFWSISVYNDKGFFEKNALGSYSLNNLTAKTDADGGYTIQFGGCVTATPNCLVTPAGWSYVVRLYRPRKAILDGTWHFPATVPAH
jgi:para-nitrobenzyl esterase